MKAQLPNGTTLPLGNGLSILAFLHHYAEGLELVPETDGDRAIIPLLEAAAQRALKPPLNGPLLMKWQAQTDATHWRGLREALKPILIRLWTDAGSKGYLTLGEILAHLATVPALRAYQGNTLDARIRELADPQVEEPPFLRHAHPNHRTGRYVLAVK